MRWWKDALKKCHSSEKAKKWWILRISNSKIRLLSFSKRLKTYKNNFSSEIKMLSDNKRWRFRKAYAFRKLLCKNSSSFPLKCPKHQYFQKEPKLTSLYCKSVLTNQPRVALKKHLGDLSVLWSSLLMGKITTKEFYFSSLSSLYNKLNAQ